MKEFDYYIFIDYSEDLIGYIIISNANVKEIAFKLAKIKHFKTVKHPQAYLSAVKKRLENEKIKNLLLRFKIKRMKLNADLFSEIIEFINANKDKNILISIDDNFYIYFMKIAGILKGRVNLHIIRESRLKKYSIEYKLNLIVDNFLAIERKKDIE